MMAYKTILFRLALLVNCTLLVQSAYGDNDEDFVTELPRYDVSSFYHPLYNADTLDSTLCTRPNFYLALKPSPRPGWYSDMKRAYQCRHLAIFIHGYMTVALQEGIDMRDQIFNHTSDVDCVLVYDWRNCSLPDPHMVPSWYPGNPALWPKCYKHVALTNLPKVAQILADSLYENLYQARKSKNLPPPAYLHLIGWSLGGQMAGTVGRILQTTRNITVDRVSALEPAGPIFEHTMHGIFKINTTFTVRKTDAKFVDVVHSSLPEDLGMIYDAGTVDFHVDINDTEYCNKFPAYLSCRHYLAVAVYLRSFFECSFVVCPSRYMINKTDPETRLTYVTCDYEKRTEWVASSAGYLANKYPAASGPYVLPLKFFSETTDPKARSCWYTNCSHYVQSSVAAKHRLCKLPNAHRDTVASCGTRVGLGATCSVRCKDRRVDVECKKRGSYKYYLAGTNKPLDDETCFETLDCAGPNGDPQSLWAIYTFPKSDGVDNGKYLFANASSMTAEKDIDGDDSALSRTLHKILYLADDFLVWSDQRPPYSLETDAGTFDYLEDAVAKVGVFGYSKGVIAIRGCNHILISHSLPMFPKLMTDKFEFPSLAKRNAQHVFCAVLEGGVPTSPDDEDTGLFAVMNEMLKFSPLVYEATNFDYNDYTLSLRRRLADLDKLFDSPPPAPKKEQKQQLVAGVVDRLPPLPISAAARRSSIDVFVLPTTLSPANVSVADITQTIADEYEQNLLSHSWNDQRTSPFNSSCDGRFQVINIDECRYNSYNWNRSVDVSKWLVSKDPTNGNLLCFGDLNRSRDNMARGGMYICIKNDNMARNYRNLVSKIEQCPAPS